jgi:SAM-dependent MidA family methyltransferase
MVEAGAHDGRLAKDILSWLHERRSELYDGFEYVIVEPSSRRREWQVATLRDFKDKVRWVEALGELAGDGVQGIIFSNELLDAMPVRRLGWDAANQTWFEWGVTDREGTLAWARMDIPKSKVQSPKSNVQRSTFNVPNPNPGIGVGNEALPWAPPELPAAVLNVLPDGFTTESCPAATDWWTAAAKVLRRGTLLTIDYGLTAEQFLAPERKDGTLRAYARHHQGQDLLTNAGEQDLTAHVNFSAVQSAGEAAGLKTEALVSQVTFLTQIAARIWKDPAAFGEWTPAHTRQFQTLTHLEHLGRPFRVLIQSRSVSEVNH